MEMNDSLTGSLEEVFVNDPMICAHNDDGEIRISARELHKALEIDTDYRHWFPRMCEYGFENGKDFRTILTESTGGRPAVDHQISIDMAKELYMIQRNEKGKAFRKYFIEVEKQWNNPVLVIGRAWQATKNLLEQTKIDCENLKKEVKAKDEKIVCLTDVNSALTAETKQWGDSSIINAIVRKYSYHIRNGDYAYGWIDFQKELLYKCGINLNERKTFWQNKNPNKKMAAYKFLAEDEIPKSIGVLVAMCEAEGVDVSDILHEHRTGGKKGFGRSSWK